MNFDFSDDQQIIRAQARRVLGERSTLAHRRDALDGRASCDRALWAELADLGFTAAALPASLGGGELGAVALCAIAEEIGRALAPVPFASTVYCAAEALLRGDDDAARVLWLPRLGAGEAIGAFAGIGSETAITARGDRLSGTASAVADLTDASIAIVHARDGAPGLFLVDLGDPGVRRKVQPGIDPASPIGRLSLDDTPAARLADGDRAETLMRTIVDRAAILVAFEQLGGAEAALYLARDYALERHAFGRPIGAFQAIKHKLAEIYVAVELARSQCYYAAWALDADDASLPVAAASARLAATAAFEHAARELIQVHGGIGMTWEHDAHLYYRRSRHLALLLGSPEHWRDLLIDRLAVERS